MDLDLQSRTMPSSLNIPIKNVHIGDDADALRSKSSEQLITSESKRSLSLENESTIVSINDNNNNNNNNNNAGIENENNNPQQSNRTMATNFQCPEQFGYFPDSTDCSRYFVCVFGDPLHETCTGGLYFSTELQTCDWPQNVICQLKNVNGKNMFNNVVNKVTSTTRSNEQNRQQHFGVNDADDDLTNVTENGKRTLNNQANIDDEKDELDGENVTESTASVEYLGTNDLDQPQFDESIASFVDQNGDVYVHDGPGGLYSLIERTASISDHDQPTTAYGSNNNVNPSSINSIEKVNDYLFY